MSCAVLVAWPLGAAAESAEEAASKVDVVVPDPLAVPRRAEDPRDDWGEGLRPRLALGIHSNEAPPVAATDTQSFSSASLERAQSASSSTPPPWLRLELDSAGFEVTPLASRSRRTESGLSRQAKIGLGVAIPIFVVGIGVAAGAAAVNNRLSSGF